jgi:hypothetical protein
MILDGTINSERQRPKPPPTSDNYESSDAERNYFDALREDSVCKEEMVHQVGEHQYREVQCWQLKEE